MPTSKLDRLNLLFEGDERIARADPSKAHIADIDFMPKVSIDKQATPTLAPAEEPWKIPVVNLYPRETTPPPPPTGRDPDLLTSSDEDEYVAAFSSKHTAKKPQTKFPPGGKSTRGSYQERALRRDNLNASAHDLADHDVEGNPLIGHFCPLALVAKFPYKYIVDTDGRISRHFFEQNKFYQRTWDIYYIDSLGSMTAKHILLLPLDQVKHLIDQINLAFKTTIDCPPDPFTVSFFDDGMPQPKHLGISHSRDDLTDMKAYILTVPDNYGEDFAQADGRPTERTFTAFKAKIERIISSTKRGKQAVKRKKRDDRFLRQQDWVKQLKRAQRYLGLRPRATQIPVPDSTTSWAEQQKQHDRDLRACGILLDPLDTSKPAPYAFESDPVIVCVDVEAYERDHRIVTEIGVSTLDTLDLAGLALGDGGENWIAHIRSRHFRIRGREHLENKDFCQGNANNFQFGKSEWVTLDSAAEAVDQCFEYPFSAQFRPRHLPTAISPLHQMLNLHGPGNTAENSASKVAVSHTLHHGQTDNGALVTSPGDQPATPCPADGQKGPRKRNVIFLGHGIRNEFEYLRRLGSQIFGPSSSTYPTSEVEMNARGVGRSETLASIIEALDTAVLYRVLLKDPQTQSLGKMMVGLGRTAWHLHNAGNDARYTLEALVALLVKARTLEDEATRPKEPNNRSGQHAETEAMAAPWEAEDKHRVAEKAHAVEQDVGHEPKECEKVLHTMKITDNSGKQIEVEDPWLMAQESDQELSQSQGVKEKENRNWVEGVDDTKNPIRCDPAATVWGHEFMGSADALDGGKAEEGGVAKMVKEGASRKKKGGRCGSGGSDLNRPYNPGPGV